MLTLPNLLAVCDFNAAHKVVDVRHTPAIGQKTAQTDHTAPVNPCVVHSGSMKINIVGTTASGKTAFGRKLAETTDKSFIEMDKIF